MATTSPASAACSIRRVYRCARNRSSAATRPAYADYIVFSLLQWARIVSTFEVIEGADAIAAWRERMLDLYGGLARKENGRAATS